MIVKRIVIYKEKYQYRRRVLAICMGLIMVWGFFKYREVKAENAEIVTTNQFLIQTLNDQINLNANAKQIIADFQNVRSGGDVKKALCAVFGGDCPTITKVAQCENGRWVFDRTNKNTDGTVDGGFLQINSVHIPRFGSGFQTDPAEHLLVARVLYNEQGLSPWASSSKCWSKQ